MNPFILLAIILGGLALLLSGLVLFGMWLFSRGLGGGKKS